MIARYKEEIEFALLKLIVDEPKLLKTIKLKKEYFFNSLSQQIFEIILKMQEQGELINYATVSGRYLDNGGFWRALEAWTGDATLGYHSPLFAPDYARQLIECYVVRQIEYKFGKGITSPKDFLDDLKKLELEFLEEKPISLDEAFKEFEGVYAEKKQKLAEGKTVGLITGFDRIDQNCSLEPGNLVILAAKTSVGKTALALNMALNAAMFGQKVLFVSAEMTTPEIMTRVLAQLTGISSTRFKYANADASMALAKKEIGACSDNFKIIEAGNMTSEDICRAVRQDGGLYDLVVVDYLQYLKDKVGKNSTNNDRVGEITRNFKALAVEIKAVVLGLSQVNRAAAGIPELHHLRDSGNLEQDADIVYILHREDKEDVVADFVVAKNRHGELIKTKLKFDHKLTKYTEYEPNK